MYYSRMNRRKRGNEKSKIEHSFFLLLDTTFFIIVVPLFTWFLTNKQTNKNKQTKKLAPIIMISPSILHTVPQFTIRQGPEKVTIYKSVWHEGIGKDQKEIVLELPPTPVCGDVKVELMHRKSTVSVWGGRKKRKKEKRKKKKKKKRTRTEKEDKRMSEGDRKKKNGNRSKRRKKERRARDCAGAASDSCVWRCLGGADA